MTTTTEITARTTTANGVAIAGRQVTSWDKIVEIRAARDEDQVLVELGSPVGGVLQGPEIRLTPAEARHLVSVLVKVTDDIEGETAPQVFSAEQEGRIREIIGEAFKPSVWRSWCVDAFEKWADYNPYARHADGRSLFERPVQAWAALVDDGRGGAMNAVAIVVEPPHPGGRLRLAWAGGPAAARDFANTLLGFPGATSCTAAPDAPPWAFAGAIGAIDDRLVEIDLGRAEVAYALEAYLSGEEPWPEGAAPRVVAIAVAAALALAKGGCHA